MTWTLRWKLADLLEGWAQSIRPSVPPITVPPIITSKLPDMPPGPSLDEVLERFRKAE